VRVVIYGDLKMSNCFVDTIEMIMKAQNTGDKELLDMVFGNVETLFRLNGLTEDEYLTLVSLIEETRGIIEYVSDRILNLIEDAQKLKH
jgi:hypothetical protein